MLRFVPLRVVVALVVVALAASASTAAADVRTNKVAGISVDIPHAWKLKASGDMMIASDPTGEAAVMFVISDDSNMKQVGDGIDARLAKMATDIKWGAQQKISLHGFHGIAMKGSAKMDKKAVATGAIIVVTAKHKGVFLLGFVEAAKAQAHKAELDAIADSLEPVK